MSVLLSTFFLLIDVALALIGGFYIGANYQAVKNPELGNLPGFWLGVALTGFAVAILIAALGSPLTNWPGPFFLAVLAWIFAFWWIKPGKIHNHTRARQMHG